MSFLSSVDAGWLGLLAIVLLGVLYIAIVSVVLGISQADRLTQNQSHSKAA